MKEKDRQLAFAGILVIFLTAIHFITPVAFPSLPWVINGILTGLQISGFCMTLFWLKEIGFGKGD